jgi:hypothetical protein
LLVSLIYARSHNAPQILRGLRGDNAAREFFACIVDVRHQILVKQKAETLGCGLAAPPSPQFVTVGLPEIQFTPYSLKIRFGVGVAKVGKVSFLGPVVHNGPDRQTALTKLVGEFRFESFHVHFVSHQALGRVEKVAGRLP